MIHHDLRARLVADTDIADIVGTRIRPLRDAQSEPYPKVIYEVVSQPEDYSTTGNTGLREARVEFTVQSDSYDEAKLIDALILTSLDAFSGTLGSSHVLGIFSDNVNEDGFEQGEGGDGYIYAINRQFQVTYE